MRLPKKYQVYEDFLSPGEIADESEDAGGEHMAWRAAPSGARTQSAHVPGVIAPNFERIAGHPGVLSFDFEHDDYVEQWFGMVAPHKLKDAARFGVTVKMEMANNDGVFIGFWKPGQSPWGGASSSMGASFGPYGVETVFRDTVYSADEMYGAFECSVQGVGDFFTPFDVEDHIDSEDWFTFEMEIDYPNRQIIFYLNGRRVHRLADADGHNIPWDETIAPIVAFWFEPNGVEREASHKLDEFGWSSATYE